MGRDTERQAKRVELKKLRVQPGESSGRKLATTRVSRERRDNYRSRDLRPVHRRYVLTYASVKVTRHSEEHALKKEKNAATHGDHDLTLVATS